MYIHLAFFPLLSACSTKLHSGEQDRQDKMTPTRKSNTAYPHFPESAALAEDKSVSSSPRGHNRKRVRHRPRSRGGSRKASSFLQHTPSPIQPAPAPTAMSIRYSYAGETALRLQMMMPATTSVSRKQWHLAARQQSAATCPCSSGRREGLWERDRRIFGGGEGGSEEEEDGLKAPMLDVVLGLFDGLDYDDDDACC